MSNTQLRVGDKVIYTMSHGTFRATIVDLYIDHVGPVVKLADKDGAFCYMAGDLLAKSKMRPAPSRVDLIKNLRTVKSLQSGELDECQIDQIMNTLELHGLDI